MDTETETTVNTENEYTVSVGMNLPNHSMTKQGRGKFITPKGMVGVPLFRTKQATYRFAAWLVLCAEVLPDEDDQPGVTFESVIDTIKNS